MVLFELGRASIRNIALQASFPLLLLKFVQKLLDLTLSDCIGLIIIPLKCCVLDPSALVTEASDALEHLNLGLSIEEGASNEHRDSMLVALGPKVEAASSILVIDHEHGVVRAHWCIQGFERKVWSRFRDRNCNLLCFELLVQLTSCIDKNSTFLSLPLNARSIVI